MRGKIVTVFAFVCLMGGLVSATTRLVPTKYATIQAAIDDSSDGDVVAVLPGRYTGPGNRDIDFLGKAITVRSIAPKKPHVVAATIIDCNGSEGDPHRGFYFDSGEDGNSVLAGLTITNGMVSGKGGAIQCVGSSPTITSCIITGNEARDGRGGGIYCRDSRPTITNCTISYNHSADRGGGVFWEFEGAAWDTTQIDNCMFIGNSAEHYGGAIQGWGGSARITGCAFIGNIAGDSGGALSELDGLIRNCTFAGNSAERWGGALYNSAVDISNCVFSGNVAGLDGGAICRRWSLWVMNTTNSAGDAIYNSWLWRVTNITNCTFAGNSAGGTGGGIYGGGFPLIVGNCIFWGNTDGSGSGESRHIDGGDVIVGFSCIQDEDPDDSNIPFGGYDNNNIDDYPMFVREPSDGGDGWGAGENDDYGDLHLLSGSPCIDAGSSWLYVGLGEEDMDGQRRIMGRTVDMGADEFFVGYVRVTKPAAGEVWVAGSLHEIEWDSYGVAGTVRVQYSTDGGMTWSAVRNNIENSGSYLWSVPRMVDSAECIISVAPRKRGQNVVCVESGLFTIHQDQPGPDVPAEWRSLGGDFGRAGLSQYEGPKFGCIQWQFETTGPISAPVTIGAYDRIHAACEDGKLYTLDANGTLLWSCDTNQPLISAPTVGADGTLYVGSEEGRLYAVDIAGHVRWTHTTDEFIYSSPAVSPDGKNIYVCSGDGIVYALGRDGSELWRFHTTGRGASGGAIMASPAVGPDGTVYIGGLNDSTLYAIEPSDGSLKWSCHFESGGRLFASPVIAEDGTIYQSSLSDCNLYAIEPDTGSILWSVKLTVDPERPWWYYDPHPYRYNRTGQGLYEPALAPDGTIYASLTHPHLMAVEPNGTAKWYTRLGTSEGYTLTVGSDGLVYAAGGDGWLCVVDPNGQELARFHSNDWLTAPVITRDGTLITTDGENRIIAVADGNCADTAYDLRRAADLDGSGIINLKDFALMAADWLSCTNANPDRWEPDCEYEGDSMYLAGDIDRSLYVDFCDAAALANQWLREY